MPSRKPVRPGWSMRRRAGLVALLAIPLLAFEFQSELRLRQAHETEIRQTALRLLELVEDEQERIIDDIHHVLASVIAMGVGQMEPSSCASALDRLKG